MEVEKGREGEEKMERGIGEEGLGRGKRGGGGEEEEVGKEEERRSWGWERRGRGN